MESEIFQIFNSSVEKFVNIGSPYFSDLTVKSILHNKNKRMLFLPTEHILNKESIDYFSRYGLRKNLMIFYQASGNQNPTVHVDYISKDERHHYSLNVIVKGQGVMKWYDPKIRGEFNSHPQSPDSIFYESFSEDLNLGDPIAVWKTGKIALVKTGIPHGTTNMMPEDRICVSIRWDKNISWKESLKIILNFIS